MRNILDDFTEPRPLTITKILSYILAIIIGLVGSYLLIKLK